MSPQGRGRCPEDRDSIADGDVSIVLLFHENSHMPANHPKDHLAIGLDSRSDPQTTPGILVSGATIKGSKREKPLPRKGLSRIWATRDAYRTFRLMGEQPR